MGVKRKPNCRDPESLIVRLASVPTLSSSLSHFVLLVSYWQVHEFHSMLCLEKWRSINDHQLRNTLSLATRPFARRAPTNVQSTGNFLQQVYLETDILVPRARQRAFELHGGRTRSTAMSHPLNGQKWVADFRMCIQNRRHYALGTTIIGDSGDAQGLACAAS